MWTTETKLVHVGESGLSVSLALGYEESLMVMRGTICYDLKQGFFQTDSSSTA